MIRGHLVCGVQNEAIQSKLLAETDLSLDKAIETTVAIKTAEHNTRELHQSLSRAKEASAVQWMARSGDSNQSGEMRAAGKPRPQLRKTPGWKRNYRCFRCLSERHGGNKCPFKMKRCFECSKVGHTRYPLTRLVPFLSLKKFLLLFRDLRKMIPERKCTACLIYRRTKCIIVIHPCAWKCDLMEIQR